MAIVVWAVIVTLLAVLLAVSWRYDRQARKRGAVPRNSSAMVGDVRINRRTTLQRESQQLLGGMTPRAQDAMNKTWQRPSPGNRD